MNGQMSSVKYSTKEIENLLKLDPSSVLSKKLGEVDNASIEQVRVLAREVLKACNVIRPSVEDLVTLP